MLTRRSSCIPSLELADRRTMNWNSGAFCSNSRATISYAVESFGNREEELIHLISDVFDTKSKVV